MNKNDLRVVKTKKTIHNALLKLLNSKQLTQIKVTELCKEASINRGTFYFHYEEVGDVFEELFEEIMLDLKRSYEEPYKNGFIHNLKTLDPNTVKIFDHVKKYEDFYKVVLAEDVAMKYYYMLFDEICNISNRDTIFSKVDEIKHDTSIMMNSFFYAHIANAIIGFIIAWYRNDFKNPVEEMNELLVRVYTSNVKLD